MNHNNKLNVGILGENIAVRYLLRTGYNILFRNFKLGFDEIDIIGRTINRKLIFFEVKALSSIVARNTFTPEDHFSYSKLKKVERAAQKFAARYSSLVDDEEGWQIDLITVLLKEGNRFGLRHYKNV